MKKNTKKILIFALALAVVIIIILCVMLFLDGKDNGNVDVTPSITPAPTETVSPSPAEPSVTPSEEPSPSGADVMTEETADGTKYTFTTPDSGISYSVTVDSDAFEYKREDGKDLFVDKSITDGSVYLELYRMEGGKAETIAPSFLDQYIKYTEFDYSGVNYISADVYGETVMANDGKTQFEAWLIDTDGGVLTVVIRYDLENASTQKTKLYDVLATMTFN